MQTTAHRLQAEFAKLVDERAKAIAASVCAGMLPDIAEYKRLTGQLAGLHEAEELLVEAAAICDRQA